jgi:Effector protein
MSWQGAAEGISSVEHWLDPALAEPVAGTPTGPGRTAPVIPGTQAGVMGHLGQLAGDLGRGLGQEGLMGLLDPVGMLDRQEAQRELRGNFDIIDPAHPPAAGTAAPNQISEEEFERTARLYSDIRLDRTHMHFGVDEMTEADQGQYRRDTMGNIGRILQTGTGREMVDGLAHNPLGHDLTFHANYDSSGALNMNSANTEPTTNEHDASTPGVGADVDMNINPTLHYTGAGWRDRRGDVVTFHEMTHAYHELRGTDDASGPVTAAGLGGSMRDANRGNVQAWEHQAVGIGTHAGDATPNENKYRAERAQIGAHGGATVVPDDVGMPQRIDYVP